MGATFFVFIAIEKTAPHAIGVYSLDEESIAIGRAQNEAAYRLLAQCRERNEWPAYDPAVQIISLPTWAKRWTADMDAAAA